MKYLKIAIVFFLFSCDNNRLFDQNFDFSETGWPTTSKPTFEVNIADNSIPYTLLCNIRHSSDYPYSRIFVRYTIADSTGNVIEKKLTSGFLFDPKTGAPLGSTGIGDVYDIRILLEEKLLFPFTGKFNIMLEQQMREDPLAGIFSAGIRLEKPKIKP
jgi:gliding motility-associated lipoprotein GldH